MSRSNTLRSRVARMEYGEVLGQARRALSRCLPPASLGRNGKLINADLALVEACLEELVVRGVQLQMWGQGLAGEADPMGPREKRSGASRTPHWRDGLA